jgi:hypothetical protein
MIMKYKSMILLFLGSSLDLTQLKRGLETELSSTVLGPGFKHTPPMPPPRIHTQKRGGRGEERRAQERREKENKNY